MTYARVNGINLYHEVNGSGDPILLIPGLGSDAGTWGTFLPVLKEGYKTIILENRGSARSTKPSGTYTTESMAEDAIALLDQLQMEQVHVVGKSMGGMIAQILAARHPERVRSLVLACTLMRHDSYGEELLEMGRILAEKAGLFETYRLAFLLSYSNEYCMTNRSRLDEARRLLAEIGSEELLQGYLSQSIACETHDSRELARQIKAPTLVIAAKEDSITTPEQSRDLAASIPNAELMIFSRGKHGFWREFPDEVNPVVLNFLARHHS
ncbi:alpha/beta hydrolase [bacterium]|nr:alpha/beta hydrolase [bacterium]